MPKTDKITALQWSGKSALIYTFSFLKIPGVYILRPQNIYCGTTYTSNSAQE